MPAATPRREERARFTNTQRLLQWREQAVEPRGDCRSELWFMYHLGRRVREKLAGSTARAATAPCSTSPGTTRPRAPTTIPTPRPSCARSAASTCRRARSVPDYRRSKDDGSTACGCWIYAGCYADGVNQVARRRPGSEQSWVAPEWGWAWPMNRRILYNRASADPDGKPWSERKRYVWWDAERGQVDGRGRPRLQGRHGARLRAARGRQRPAALRGDEPFIMQADGRAWLFAPSGPRRRPAADALRAARVAVRQPALRARRSNPRASEIRRRENPYNPTHGEPGPTSSRTS